MNAKKLIGIMVMRAVVLLTGCGSNKAYLKVNPGDADVKDQGDGSSDHF
jgi:major membrane immunogen (membrane-anchored lipoprotein)